ncbi:MAG: efflux RND transporter periplasmic adaptor subunit [Lachnospiraceae bacterium]|nr:efflux RND transporter periplasmic adaptor subunit [Lachnospiraceae bacterium]
MKGKKIIVGTLLIAVLGGSLFFTTAFMRKAVGYSTGTVSYKNIAQNVEATGDVHGEETMTYYSNITAPVNYYELSVGDEVKKGQRVVGYDLEDLITLRDQAELTAKSAENTMYGQVKKSESNQAKYNKAESDIEVYKNTYALFRLASDYVNQDQYQENWDINCIAASLNKDIADKTGAINSLTLELEKAQMYQDVNEVNRLVSEIETLNEDVADLQADLAGLPPATLSPEEYATTVINGNWMSDILRNWTETSTLKNTYENQILNSYQKEQLQNSYELSALNVDTAEENLTKATEGVVVEYDGIVTESYIKNGSVVTKGTPLFTLESSKDMKVDVGISKFDIGKIAVGQRADIDIAGNGYTGSVTGIKRIAESDNSDKAKVSVSVKFDAPDEKVYIGLEADVKIYTEEKEGVLVIPLEAYYADDEGDYCYIIKDGTVQKQYITTGIETDEYIEITLGLKEGDIVITDAVTDEQVGTKAESK